MALNIYITYTVSARALKLYIHNNTQYGTISWYHVAHQFVFLGML